MHLLSLLRKAGDRLPILATKFVVHYILNIYKNISSERVKDKFNNLMVGMM